MSIADKMENSPIPDRIHIELLQSQVKELLAMFLDLRELYRESSGVTYVPSQYLDKITATVADSEWLSRLGISGGLDV